MISQTLIDRASVLSTRLSQDIVEGFCLPGERFTNNLASVLRSDTTISNEFITFDNNRRYLITYLQSVITQINGGADVDIDDEGITTNENILKQQCSEITSHIDNNYTLTHTATKPSAQWGGMGFTLLGDFTNPDSTFYITWTMASTTTNQTARTPVLSSKTNWIMIGAIGLVILGGIMLVSKNKGGVK